MLWKHDASDKQIIGIGHQDRFVLPQCKVMSTRLIALVCVLNTFLKLIYKDGEIYKGQGIYKKLDCGNT